jgi:hypothetical protein
VANPERERVAIFITFGLDDHHLKRYIPYLKTRQYMVEIWKSMKWDDDVWEAVKCKNLTLRNVWQEIKGESGVGLNKGYAPIPY